MSQMVERGAAWLSVAPSLYGPLVWGVVGQNGGSTVMAAVLLSEGEKAFIVHGVQVFCYSPCCITNIII